MPTTPTPFSGAPTTDATDVPCSPPMFAGSCALSAVVSARPANSGWAEVEAGVDEADRHARARRREAVDTDLREPPLVGLEGIDRVGGRRDPVRPLGLGEQQRPACAQSGHQGRRAPGVEAPEMKRCVDLLRASICERARFSGGGTGAQPDDRRRAGVGGRGLRRRRCPQGERCHGEGYEEAGRRDHGIVEE